MRAELLRDLSGTGAPTEPWPTVNGYELVRQIHKSAECTVYLARSQANGTAHNITTFRVDADENASSPWFEAVVAAQRRIESHNSIERIIETVRANSLLCAVSEPITGPTLEEILSAEGARPLDWTVEMGSQIGSALDFIAAHGRDSHGCLTPSTIRFDSANNRFVLLHYVFAHLAPPSPSAYSAPEIHAADPPTPWSDLYSLGAILYAALAGRPPFVDDVNTSPASQTRSARIPELSDEPAYVRNVLSRLTERNPRERYRVAVDAIDDLRSQRSPALVLDGAPGGAAIDPAASAASKASRTRSVSIRSPYAIVALGAGRLTAAYRRSGLSRSAARVGNTIRSLVMAPVHLLVSLSTAYSGKRPRRASDLYKVPRRMSSLEMALRGIAVWVFRIGARVAAIAALLSAGHSFYLAVEQRFATVTEVSGNPNLLVVRQRSPILNRDKIDAASMPIIKTGVNDTLDLDIADAIIHVEPKSALQIRRLDIEGPGRVTVLQLQAGQVSVQLPRLYPVSSRFEITSAGVRTRIATGQCRITSNGDIVNVQVRDGKAAVIAGDTRSEVTRAKQIWATELGINRHGPVSDHTMSAIQDQTGGPTTHAAWLPIVEAYRRIEEARLVPAANRILEVTHLKPTKTSMLQNAIAVSTARASLAGLAEVLEADGSPPQHLDTQRLAETSLDPDAVSSILAPFEGHRLLAYYRLSGDDYTLFGRANDSNHSLLRLCSGKVTVLSEEDEEQALANAHKKWRATNAAELISER